MGTLTTDCPRLDSHCPHKLATSCRLTSTPNCCACADERPHSRTYAVYIDGIGFVQRGTRWQSYCWFCKEFWNNRLAATDPPLEVSQTQVPQIPDQTEFLERWFEFHQGYRIVKGADGTEHRIAVIGEPLRDVSPGFLPRTLDQLRARRANDAQRAENRFRRRRLSSEEHRPQEPQQSLEDALDSLLEELSDHETDGREDTAESQEAEDPDMPRREATGLSRPLTRTEHFSQRARDRIARVFGTREEVEQEDYVSPLASIFVRAEQRHERAEELRASGDAIAPPNLDSLAIDERRRIEHEILWGVMRDSRRSVLDDESANDETATANQSNTPFPDSFELDSREIDLTLRNDSAISSNTVPSTREPPSASMTTTSSSASTSNASELRTSLERINNELARIRSATDLVTGARLASLTRRGLFPAPELDMDKQNRPPPLDDGQMTKTLACQVCYCQLADIALLPCGHMVLCEWCADTMIPVKHSHVPLKASRCPVCRKAVKQRFKIHM